MVITLHLFEQHFKVVVFAATTHLSMVAVGVVGVYTIISNNIKERIVHVSSPASQVPIGH